MQDKKLKSILLVEDDEDIRVIAKMSLEMAGDVEVLSCNSGVEAVSRAGDFDVDLVIMDVMMPEMDGPEALAQLRKHESFTHTPFIFMTAKTQTKELQSYMSMSVIGVISKPFDPMTLADEVLALWANKNQLG